MRIGLVNPSSEYKPDKSLSDLVYLNGLAFINSVLREDGHEVRIVDFKNDPEADLSSLRDCEIIGLTSYFESYRAFRQVLPKLKSKDKKIFVGGTLISSYGLKDNLIMELFPEIDYAVIGEGENTTRELIKHLEGKTDIPPGVIFREGENTKDFGNGKIVENLDDIPGINYEHWEAFSKRATGRAIGLQQTTRGCPNKCSFCYNLTPKVRSFSISRIERMLEDINRLKPREIFIPDETFTYDKKRAFAITDRIKQTRIPYAITTRVDRLDKEMAQHLKDTGCKLMLFGIESFDEQILRRVNKKISLQGVYDAIKLGQSIGINTRGFFIVGLPGENNKSIKRTINEIKRTGIIPQARLLIPLPGTQIYKNLLKKDSINEEELLMQFSLPEQFDTKYGNWVPINLSDGLSDEELIEARDEINAIGED